MQKASILAGLDGIPSVELASVKASQLPEYWGTVPAYDVGLELRELIHNSLCELQDAQLLCEKHIAGCKRAIRWYCEGLLSIFAEEDDRERIVELQNTALALFPSESCRPEWN